MYHRQILCNSNKPEMGKDSTHGLARPRACPHFRRPQIRLFHPLFQQIPSFRQQQSLILPTLFYDKYYNPIAGDTTLKKSPSIPILYRCKPVRQYIVKMLTFYSLKYKRLNLKNVKVFKFGFWFSLDQ